MRECERERKTERGRLRESEKEGFIILYRAYGLYVKRKIYFVFFFFVIFLYFKVVVQWYLSMKT